MSKLKPVTKTHPCLVCGGTHKCSFNVEGLLLCGRKTGEQPGFVCLGPAKNPTWTMYKVEDFRGPASTSEVEAGAGTSTATKAKRTPSTSEVEAGLRKSENFEAIARKFARQLMPARSKELAEKLNLPEAALALLPDLGWDDATNCWTIPERDANGEIVGISTRRVDGTKRCVAGSRRGLVMPGGAADAEGPLFVVEGMSDALALAHLGLGAIGRPSANVGGAMLAALLAGADSKRPIIVLAENDRKPDGRWPGRDGAEAVAKHLAGELKGRKVFCACPPEGQKDAREWVTARLAPGVDPLELGKEIATTIGNAAKAVVAPRADFARRWPAPVGIRTIAAEVDADPNPTGWLWDGFLPRNGLAILSALPKCGKTTLLTHLLAALGSGGDFLGRPLMPGRAVVLTEEDKAVWAERQKRLNLGDQVALVIRPFLGRPNMDDWIAFLASLAADVEADGRDLIILDTLADLWPVRDENHATDVTDALKPLRKLASAGRTVLCIHHVRKSGGEHGTASRGSGAIAGFFDVMLELGYATGDPDGRRRRILAKGRLDGIPAETLVEMTKDGEGYKIVDERKKDAARVQQREEGEEARRSTLREVLCVTVPFGEDKAMTREEIWNRLPEEIRVNVKRFEAVLEAEVGKLWTRKKMASNVASVYWRGKI